LGKGGHARERTGDGTATRSVHASEPECGVLFLCLRVAAEREREAGLGGAGQAWTLMGRALTEMPLPRARICARALSVSLRLL
jgi:hypothetical protein